MTMITIIQVNPRLTSTFGPLPVIGAQRLMEGYDSLPPSLSYAAYYPRAEVRGVSITHTRHNLGTAKVFAPSRRP